MRSKPLHNLAGLVLPFGEFDLTLNLPKVSSFTKRLVINLESLEHFNEAYLPGMDIAGRRSPSVSPIYEDMEALVASVPSRSLPAALFLCGTEDPLLDDTLLMSTKWTMAGGETIVKIYPGAAHGFTGFPGTDAQEAAALCTHFVKEKLAHTVEHKQ